MAKGTKYFYGAKLLRVVDGDTFDALIDLGFKTFVKNRIRYMGIDTWESRTRDLEEKKKPIDYRRSGVISLFVGLGLFLFGTVSSIGILKGVGLLVGAIGVGSIIAGYLYPNESAEITKAVEDFEKKKTWAKTTKNFTTTLKN